MYINKKLLNQLATAQYDCTLIYDVTQVVEPSRVRLFAFGDPALTRLSTLPGTRREAENLNLDAAAFKRSCKDISAHCRDGYRSAAH